MVDSITVDTTPLTTTGGHTWPAARHLLRYLEHCYATDTHAMRSNRALRVLELGAGCGWLGTVLATNLPTAVVCVTEQQAGGALDWLQHNVRRAGLPNLWAAPCDWSQVLQPGPPTTDEVQASEALHPPGSSFTSRADVQLRGHCGDVPPQLDDCGMQAQRVKTSEQETNVLLHQWDLVIGSDLVYNEAGTQWLPLVFSTLLRQAPCALYCHTKHRYDLLDIEFFQALEACGVACQEVCDPAEDPPPASPPLCFPGELFGEQRIAVFALTLAR